MRRHLSSVKIKDGVLDLPDHAEACLTCACRNSLNDAGQALVATTGAQSATGVLAAIFMAAADELADIVQLARAAITEQREYCVLNPHTLPPDCQLQPYTRINDRQALVTG